MSKVIYAAYGSNLLKERLEKYIYGGLYKGREYKGCSDKSAPEDLGWIRVPYRLYFAKKSSRWENKGVAFLSCNREKNEDYHAVVRMWKINKKQLEEIWDQEGRSWYSKKLYLGDKDGLKIYTFTGCWERELNLPSYSYLDVIKKGLKETTQWDKSKVEEYLLKFIKGEIE